MKRGLQWLGMLACLSCAGDLKDPGRFGFLNDADDGGLPTGMDSGTQPMTAAPSCAVNLFSKTCGLAGCHSTGAPQVDLVSANVASRLVDKPSSNNLECKGRTLVSTSGDSLLIDKLSDDPPCGSPMPVGGTLSDKDRTCLTTWVSSLANQN